MKTGDLGKLFGVDSKTITNWTKEFGEWLSDGAQGKAGRHRIFDQSDFVVMATIAELTQKQKLPYSAVHDKLAEGYRVEDPTAETVGYEDGRTVPAAVVEQIIDATEIKTQLSQVTAERDALQRQLEEMTVRAARYENERDASNAQVQELLKQIAELERELGRLEGRQQERDKRRRWL